jgi:23S rRNA (adenine2503-C2)-methyltransferase
MPSIYDVSLAELQALVEAGSYPRFRAKQVWEWAYRHLAGSYDEMSNVPAALRARLASELPFPDAATVREIASDDRLTRKRLVRLPDGTLIESVLMLYDPRSDSRGRATVCVSSQAGCAMGCYFCATGQAGFQRNLTAGEIVAQVVEFAREQRARADRPITNVVFMGMGEPMANYANVWRAIETLTSPEGFGLGARHITVSTVGLPAGIRRLAGERLQIGLAVSIHAPDQELRESMIATANRYPIADIIAACREYAERTRRRVTLEYCVIEGVNDSPEQARKLARLLKGITCHVNLIPVNPTSDGSVKRPSRTRTIAFQRELAAHGVACTIRVEKGVEISAACGQLRGAPTRDAVNLRPV